MEAAPLPPNEAQRLEKLIRYDILDTPPEAAFDRITRIIAHTIEVPIALVSLIDQRRQWFKSHHGLNTRETPREFAFCAHAILGDGVFVVEDAQHDGRFHDNPLVAVDPTIRFYAGAPLITPDGFKLGTLCAIDRMPRRLTERHAQLLQDMATLVIDELELRNALRDAVENVEAQRRLRIEAETARMAKSNFLASMSHEIRTPMNAIIGLTSCALNSDSDDQKKAYLSHVRRAGESLLSLINDILDYTRIESGKIEIETIDFSLSNVLSQVVSVVGGAAQDNGNELIFEISPALPDKLTGDPLRLAQVLMNLLGNAAKFTKNGDVSVEIVPISRADGAKGLTIIVRDTGIGMTAQQAKACFEPFVQADESVARSFGGSGLGLTITRDLVNAMGGEIYLESAPGVGSTFTARLPFEFTAAPGPWGGDPPSDVEGFKVILIEAHDQARRALAARLESMGADVSEVNSAEQLDLILREETDTSALAIIDAGVSWASAPDVLERVRGPATSPHTRVILTVPGFGEDSELYYQDPPSVDVCLRRPIVTSQLPAIVCHAMGWGDADDASSAAAVSISARREWRGVKILNVEDNEMNRLVLEGILEHAGLELDFAIDAEQAIEMLAKNGEDHYGAVLMDVQLPRMDGRTATKKIRKELGYTSIPIIALTAHAFAEERQMCLSAGMTDYLSKPISVRDLFGKLNVHIKVGAGDASGEEPQSMGHAAFVTERPVWHFGNALEVLTLDPERALGFVDKFVQRYSDIDTKVRQQYEEEGFESAAKLIHAFRGAASALAADVLEEQARQIEQHLNSHDSDKFEADFPEFSDVLSRTVRDMKAVTGASHG